MPLASLRAFRIPASRGAIVARVAQPGARAYLTSGILWVALIGYAVFLGVTLVWVVSPTLYGTIVEWGLNHW